MTCPACGVPGAYVGFLEIDCPNPMCAHYRPDMPEAEETAPGRTEPSATPLPLTTTVGITTGSTTTIPLPPPYWFVRS